MSAEASLPSPSLSGQAGVHSVSTSLLVKAMNGILYASPDPIFIVDRQGRYLAVGQAGEAKTFKRWLSFMTSSPGKPKAVERML